MLKQQAIKVGKMVVGLSVMGVTTLAITGVLSRYELKGTDRIIARVGTGVVALVAGDLVTERLFGQGLLPGQFVDPQE